MKPRTGWAGLPRRLRVGWRRLRIAPLDRKAARSFAGRTIMADQHIGIDAALEPDLLVETVVHELLHVILYVWGREDEHDEDQVEALASGLVALMQDNPELIRWALATLEQEQ